MDYEGKYTGPEIDAQLDKVGENTEAISLLITESEKQKKVVKKLNAAGPLKVVAARRIPNEHWGEFPVRFATRPTFVVKIEDAEQLPNNFYRIAAPTIMKCLLEQNVIKCYNLPEMYYYEDGYLYFSDISVRNRPMVAFNEPLGIGRIWFVYTETKNAIRLLGYDENNLPVFKSIAVHDAETTSPYLKIQGGKISGQGTVTCGVGKDPSWGFTVSPSAKCYMKIRRTGHMPTETFGGHEFQRKTKWSYIRRTKGIGKRIITPGIYRPRELSNVFSERGNRIKVRFYKVIKRGRFISPTYTEVYKYVRDFQQ